MNQKMSVTETKIWRAWYDSSLGQLDREKGGSPLVNLLLAARSKSEIERLSKVLPDDCKPSNELLRALKGVWQIAEENNERWALLDLSIGDHKIGTGLTEFYWSRLSERRPKVKIVSDKVREKGEIDRRSEYNRKHYDLIALTRHVNGNVPRTRKKVSVNLPVIEPNSFFLDGKIQAYDPRASRRAGRTHSHDYKAVMKPSPESEDKGYLVGIDCFYPFSGSTVFVVMSFTTHFCTEANIVWFAKAMPDYRVIDGWSYDINATSRICYPIEVDSERFLRIGLFEYYDLNKHVQYIEPQDGFFDLIKQELVRIGVPFVDSITENRPRAYK